jgi:hypothetical protein
MNLKQIYVEETGSILDAWICNDCDDGEYVKWLEDRLSTIAQQPLSGSEQSSSPKCHHHDGDLTCEKTGEKTACEANKDSCEDW